MRDVFDAHERALRPANGGGAPGVRDQASLEAAIGRPFTGYYHRISAKAAALAESLARNHGFIDGNKRTTFFIVDVFLDRSGYELRGIAAGHDEELEELIVSIADTHPTIATITQWFRVRLHKK